MSKRVIGLYDRHAAEWDRDRGRSLFEHPWLERFTSDLPSGAAILDLGCGSGEPLARYLIEAGFSVVGVDASPSLIAICRDRFPDHEWIVGDMRDVRLERRLDAILAWDSFFHLSKADQRGMMPRFAGWALPGARLMFTSGPADGEAIGTYGGEPLFHASLSPAEYRERLSANGFSVVDHRVEDPECGGHTIWLSRFEAEPVK